MTFGPWLVTRWRVPHGHLAVEERSRHTSVGSSASVAAAALEHQRPRRVGVDVAGVQVTVEPPSPRVAPWLAAVNVVPVGRGDRHLDPDTAWSPVLLSRIRDG